MILVVAVVIVVIGSSVWIALPLLSTRELLVPSNDRSMSDLSESKLLLYRTILDLEFDHNLGKVSDADFIHLRKQHETEAVSLLSQMDGEASSGDISDVIEEEIALVRARLKERR